MNVILVSLDKTLEKKEPSWVKTQGKSVSITVHAHFLGLPGPLFPLRGLPFRLGGPEFLTLTGRREVVVGSKPWFLSYDDRSSLEFSRLGKAGNQVL